MCLTGRFALVPPRCFEHACRSLNEQRLANIIPVFLIKVTVLYLFSVVRTQAEENRSHKTNLPRRLLSIILITSQKHHLDYRAGAQKEWLVFFLDIYSKRYVIMVRQKRCTGTLASTITNFSSLEKWSGLNFKIKLSGSHPFSLMPVMCLSVLEKSKPPNQ